MSHAGTDHQHDSPGAKYAAARDQRNAVTIGWIDDDPISRDRLDNRITQLRNSPRAGLLPVRGSGEDRQLMRWTAHVLFTEEICRREVAGQESTEGGNQGLDDVAAAQLGSIYAAAWQACDAVQIAFHAMTAAPPTPRANANPRRWWKVSIAADIASDAGWHSIGWTTLHDVPHPLAAQLRDGNVGDVVGPVSSSWGRHRARVDEMSDVVEPRDDHFRQGHGERLREFARWLDQQRSWRLRPVAGFEHPGDPAQPDNTHRH